MASLAQRESLAGKVQMIYLDPPYGSNYSPPLRRDYPERMTGTPASAARRASSAVKPCSRPVAITLAAAA